MGKRIGAYGVLRFLIPLLVAIAAAGAAGAQTTAPPVQPPVEVQQLLRLMQTPQVKEWMARQTNAAPPAVSREAEEMSVLSDLVDQARRHVDMVSGAAMDLPEEVTSASAIVEQEIAPAGWALVTTEVLVLLLAGAAAEMLFRLVAPRPRIRGDGEVPTVVHHAAANLLHRMMPAIVFAVATLVPLFAFDWPPVTRSMAIAIAIALIVARFTIALGHLLVALVTLPRADSGSNVSRVQASFWFRHCAIFVIYFAFGWAAIQLLVPLGFSTGARYLVGYALGIGLFLIAAEAVWSRPSEDGSRSLAVSWGLTLYFALLWILWVTGFNLLLWIGIYAVLLPRVLAVATSAIRSLHQAEAGFLAHRPFVTALLDRGVRAIIIAAAALWLGRMLGLAADRMAAGDTMVDRLTRGALGGIVILLVADLLWHLARAYINGKLEEARVDEAATDEEKAKRARLRTLLPIFRNILAVVIAVIAVLMVLSGMGVQIGPLIAGAGVVGVAVGFGAQTIVKDVISGMFYLWDDAFRVGEYIESGNHKGVVEAFSLRSVKLRHHRGPLTTVPFGELGAVKNLNRDWTIDKITLNLTYDTDLVKVKKVIKQIGQQLLDNPEFGPHIIETLKMKGVEQFGDFAIVIRLAMMTKPGEQFVIRRNALAMIRTAFKENGIEFAVPTVQVAGEGREAEMNAVAARHFAQKPDPASEPAA
ncbi:mechanosensitive ion channel family protein [Rhizobium sp. P32RR-XVIII]|uniref:mechanosensitive ion channel family protein n=1 Tax=Rhizobium sp. P32RR-XVIII TaxID=2726738 RepID=UPI001457401C|nr:mechanosensitive ion channel family protein [Rhizobium sp. P32RR-XVIII]NLS05563.1 mechanosensitive ion channel family protein [Rhizobium sp. P32RR-XVIII]